MNEMYNEIRVKTKEDWLKVLDIEEKLDKNAIEIIKYIYFENQHMTNCQKVAFHFKTSVVGVNSKVAAFGTRTMNILNLLNQKNESGGNRKWNIPFETIEYLNQEKFIWKIRPELVLALEEKYNLKTKYLSGIDRQVIDVFENFNKFWKLFSNLEYLNLEKEIVKIYKNIKDMKKVEEVYIYFFDYASKNDCIYDQIFEKYKIISPCKITDYLKEKYSNELNNDILNDELILLKIKEEKEKINYSTEEILEKALSCEKKEVETKIVSTIYRYRNLCVSECTKLRAKGVCDLCNQKSPFLDKNNKPYLECHHLVNLSKNGPDNIYNTVALCPNCHRKMHILNNPLDNIILTKKIQSYLLNSNAKKLINEFNKLFNIKE